MNCISPSVRACLANRAELHTEFHLIQPCHVFFGSLGRFTASVRRNYEY